MLVTFDSDSHGGFGCVTVSGLDPELLASVRVDSHSRGRLGSSLRVAVLGAQCAGGEILPDVLGRYELLQDGIRFVPRFPFEPGVRYRATFDPSYGPRTTRRSGSPDLLAHEFSLPVDQNVLSSRVEHVFPSSDCLPENMLRFYVCFSNSMRRGQAEGQIELLDSDGQRVPDLLYRPPVELWDRNMRHLTILLDPGRIKRGLGPNVILGPPLKAGQEYTLTIGSGMTDKSGRPLGELYSKRFRVTRAVRERIAVENWEVVPPEAESSQPLELRFLRPLDRAMLSHAINIVSEDSQMVAGKLLIDRNETCWNFTPISPWRAGVYHIRVAPDLEDVCGNSVMAAFDKAIESCGDATGGRIKRSITFHVANGHHGSSTV
jgi:hypothetical protein